MRRPNARRALVGAVAAATIGAVILSVAGTRSFGGASPSSLSSTDWTVYHGDPSGTGVSSALTRVDTSKKKWVSPALSGQIYGEPLVYSGRVFVATENDVVYALSSTNGHVVWSRHLASAVPSSLLPCGDIAPTVGITGTPVIDPSRNEIFVVADELVHGGSHHTLVGLSTTSGKVEVNERVDPPGATPSALLQRTGLNLDAGRVVFAMGGNYGDCASYRGRVVSVKETGSTPTFFTVDAASGDSQGAIWMGGAAPEVDAHDNVWVSVGNGSVYSASQSYDDSDSVLELSASLRLKQYFAPSTWPQDNSHDFDMSTAPVLFGNGQVLLAGKSPIIYLLNGAHLGGIGSQEASLSGACSNDIDGGSAVVGTTAYLPCVDGPVAVRVTSSPRALKVLWRSDVGGGPPLVAAGLVWTIGQNGVLYGLAPSTGKVRQRTTVGTPANHFPTPSVGDSLMLVATANRVVAFHAVVAS